MAARDDAGGGTGGARRRESDASMLTSSIAQRQRTARAREEVLYTAAFRTSIPPPEPELFDLFEEPGGGRLPPLTEVRSHGLLERHTGVGFELVFDPVVPQLGRELVDVPIVEQIVDIPVLLVEVFKVYAQDSVHLFLCQRQS